MLFVSSCLFESRHSIFVYHIYPYNCPYHVLNVRPEECKFERIWRFQQSKGHTDTTHSTLTTHPGTGAPSVSARNTDDSNRSNAARSSNSPPNPSTNHSTTPRVVIPFAVPANTPEQPLQTQGPPFPQHNTSSHMFRLPHENDPRSCNHYVSCPSAPNPHYYASSSDNPRSDDTVRLEAAYQEPNSVEIYNHAYEGTTDDVQSNIMLENVNSYHCISSSMEIGSGRATSYEEAYQVPSAVVVTDHDYQGKSDEQKQSKAVLSGGISMEFRPLPHRPSSANCNEGPTLPPRKSSRGQKHFLLKQRNSNIDKENNNFPGACSVDSKGLRHIPKKREQEKKEIDKDMTPFYHTLEKDELTRSLGEDNQGPISTNSQGNTIRSRVHGNTDLINTDRMIDNVLYVPMTSCQKKYSHS
ncbi:uncharacterized protein LOC121406499 [Lytechinus variegatus]|uniref:uncharacterized protein LOC121406499 n=1 Tax=Lytechinus variegatus TaxID=7654 RepID=UPI001BB1705D|nr:uncharacterized protein LOC121406499 [Lytechinus variegatus]